MKESKGDNEDPPDSALYHLAQYSGHGLTIAASMGVFLAAGWWLDGKLGTRPLLTIGGALLGAAGGLYSLLQHLIFMPQREEEERREREKAGSGDAE